MEHADFAFSLHFDPLLPEIWIITLAICAGGLITLSALRQKHRVIWRFLAFCAFLVALMNPALLKEERQPVKDVAAIVVDKSDSQNTENRKTQTQNTLAYLKKILEGRDNLDLRIVDAPGDNIPHEETKVFQALDQALADVPEQRRAGVIMITDGQVHDVPQNPEQFSAYGPVHALITGRKNEKDRRIVITQGPAYGIVGQKVTMKYIVEDSNAPKDEIVAVTFSRDSDENKDVRFVPVNEEQSEELPITHGAQNIFELSVAEVPDEITTSNNHTALIVNGVRDRLRVLLISGQPHAGGRTWRDLLTSDPSVDLVHFTILREPEKLDNTPQNELSLIAFPFQELFEVKLYDFDLIIFDRYRLNRILPLHYFQNIARYVEEGGALLEASGPSFAGNHSVYYTALMNVLPATPTGDVTRKPFFPTLTKEGKHHPVTETLLSYNKDLPENLRWGPWLRQVALTPERGEVVMRGADNEPLLILDHVKKGRVAQLASDHLWLWARGFQGGGPYTELLRRTAHWLMKEPELDEDALEVQTEEYNIHLRTRNAPEEQSISQTVTMTLPDGAQQTVPLKPEDDEEWLEGDIKAQNAGIYSFESKTGQKRFAIIGSLNPPEQKDTKATEDKLRPIVKKSGGDLIWLEDTPHPGIRFLSGARQNFSGRGWLALRQNHDYAVTGFKKTPLCPPWAYALALLGLCVFAWWREGKH